MEKISLYIHIPFCVKKCLYCDFPSFSGLEMAYSSYVDSLIKEIDNQSLEFKHVSVKTIFIGGGTPTALPYLHLCKILDRILNKFNVENNCEITVESNPGTIDKIYLKNLKSACFNRLSFGVQSLNDEVLKRLGRIHNKEIFLKNFNEAKEIGFNNINCDVMFSLPNENITSFEKTIEEISNLNLQHISAYSLIVEEGTPFKELYDKKIYKYNEESLDREMYYMTREILKNKGFHQYEISNFAKEGFESLHNVAYWQTTPYLGLGLGSHSYINGTRYNNIYNLDEYIRHKGNILCLKENEETLSYEEKIEEFMFMGLRMTKGINFETFENRFNKNIYDFFKNEINELLELQLLEIKGKNMFLTHKGIDVSNMVFEKFIFNS